MSTQPRRRRLECEEIGDVTVVNFISKDNEAHRLTFEILSRKLDLFGKILDATDNVLYDPGDHVPGSTVYACLAHDIVAHETTHAILDGMHRRFNTTTTSIVDLMMFGLRHPLQTNRQCAALAGDRQIWMDVAITFSVCIQSGTCWTFD